MNFFDLNDDIIPGKSAAGFQLGIHIDNCKDILQNAIEVKDIVGQDLVKVISNTLGILLIHNLRSSQKNKTTVYFQYDTVRLLFNKNDYLYCIYLFKGYQGKVFNDIGIGDMLKKVAEKFPIYYDEHDEMHYPDNDQGANIEGISFIASDSPIDDLPKQLISGICVHDWSLQ